MTASSPVSPRHRNTGPWLCVGAVAAYVLASPFFLRGTPDGATWVVLWIVLGIAAVGLAATGVVLATRSGRDHLDELHHLDGENHDLAGLAETRRVVLENLVDQQLPAVTNGATPPPLPDAAGDAVTADLLGRAVAQLGRVREDQRAGHEAVQAAVVSLGRKVQASAHRIQEEAARMVQRHPTDADVLHTSMRVDHAAAQQARNAQSLAALCGEAPGQQWHQALPLADTVRAAAGRITAYQRVEVSGDPGVAVSARVVEPLIHVIAELLANATQSSPPTTQVLVSLRHVQRGAVIEIDDGGVGLDDSRLDQVREIASGRRPVGLADLGQIPQTGLPVVGAYVRRHGFRVDITESVYGGLRAIVLVPAELTEPVAPGGLVSTGGHALTRRSERRAAPEPQPEPQPEPAPELEPVLAEDPVVPAASSGELPALPRRRSRRAEARRASTVDWPAERDPEPVQTAEQAGQWMGAFLSTAGDLTEPDRRDHVHYADADESREEQR
ncbi:MAG: ATP-binding protein [Actinophytocola sp.]|uniref:ATP-binding protein n=1 Tax=Actinophytocola sp. TaxID=1872138 RepID=UPI003D6BD0E8